MRAQRLRFRVLGVELPDEFAPQQPAGAQLGDLHEEVHSDAPEERQPRRELVDGKPGGQPCLDVVEAVGQRVGQLQIRGGAGLLDVIAGDRDRVESRHLGAGVAEDVGDDPHRRLRRVDVGVADHELLEDVVLDRPGQLLRRHALLLGGHHVQRQNRQHRAVHRHRHRHRGQVDAVEQLAHVQDRVDRHPGHPDIALHARMIGVITAVGGQVERHRQALLARGQVAPVEGIRIRGGGEAGVLADGPGLVDVHRRIGTPDVRHRPGEAVQRIARGDRGIAVGGDVHRLDVDVLRGDPVQLIRSVAVRGRCGRNMLGDSGFGGWFPAALAVQWNVGEAADSRCSRHR